jgi:predicted nucleic acid-binding protein
VGRSAVSTSGQTPRPQRTFLDTNILLYCDDRADTRKQQLALTLVLQHRKQRTGVVSIQVLQEYFVNAKRKLGLDSGLARRKVEAYSHFELVEPTLPDVLAAIDIHRLHSISYWDALVIHCAKRSGCGVLLSEGLQNGQSIDGVRVMNPFL